MEDLISRKAAIESIKDPVVRGFALYALKSMPSVDAVPVKHGRWIYPKEELTISGKCSCCGWEAHYYEDDVADMPYCPNCGARMDLEEKDAAD